MSTARRALILTPLILAAAGAAGSSRAAPVRAHHAEHFACSGPNSSKTPCHFATPSGNIRCLWTPHPNNVVCEVLATRHGFRLRPSGRAKAIVLNLKRRGQTLPRNQQVEFPQSMSCHDTSTTMTCNQNFASGAFKLGHKR